jgi:triosephosphate isomerase
LNQKNNNRQNNQTKKKTRPLLIAGNWKMYKDHNEAYSLALALKERLVDVNDIQVVLCPPFTSLQAVSLAIQGSSLLLGAQDVHWEREGAFTGEVSPAMLLSLGCKYVIIGHSERRLLFHESDKIVNLKLKASLKENLIPLLCIGETLQEREKGKTEEVVENQLKGAFVELSPEDIGKLVLAYEPVWAIGTGKTATPKQANDVHLFIRKKLEEKYSQDIAKNLTILYGGSVKPENAKDLLKEPDIDGALVGGASLDADSFEKIVRSGLNL